MPAIETGFDAWMRQLDNLCQIRTGVSIHDLPDHPFADYFDDGLSPVEAMTEIAESEDF